jgi:hypothetical protein
VDLLKFTLLACLHRILSPLLVAFLMQPANVIVIGRLRFPARCVDAVIAGPLP